MGAYYCSATCAAKLTQAVVMPWWAWVLIGVAVVGLVGVAWVVYLAEMFKSGDE